MIPFPTFLPGTITLEPGTSRDYVALERFHYRPSRPSTWAAVWVARYRAPGVGPDEPGRLIAVGVLSWPTFVSTGRNRHFRLDGKSLLDKINWANENVRTISRVVVHPQFRSIGLATALVRCLCDHCPTRYVESASMMGRAHPLFERAGMTKVEPGDESKPVYYVLDRQARMRKGEVRRPTPRVARAFALLTENEAQRRKRSLRVVRRSDVGRRADDLVPAFRTPRRVGAGVVTAVGASTRARSVSTTQRQPYQGDRREDHDRGDMSKRKRAPVEPRITVAFPARREFERRRASDALDVERKVRPTDVRAVILEDQEHAPISGHCLDLERLPIDAQEITDEGASHPRSRHNQRHRARHDREGGEELSSHGREGYRRRAGCRKGRRLGCGFARPFTDEARNRKRSPRRVRRSEGLRHKFVPAFRTPRRVGAGVVTAVGALAGHEAFTATPPEDRGEGRQGHDRHVRDLHTERDSGDMGGLAPHAESEQRRWRFTMCVRLQVGVVPAPTGGAGRLRKDEDQSNGPGPGEEHHAQRWTGPHRDVLNKHTAHEQHTGEQERRARHDREDGKEFPLHGREAYPNGVESRKRSGVACAFALRVSPEAQRRKRTVTVRATSGRGPPWGLTRRGSGALVTD
jgi:GNAT superfamily N-acetyltransferase